MSKLTLHSFGSVDIEANDVCISLSQVDSEAGIQQIDVARDQLPSLIRLLQEISEATA